MLLRPTALAIAAALAFGAPAALADSIPTLAAEVQPASRAPAPASRGDATAYAHRERTNPHAADYRGGGIVVIGISGGALIVILLLLLILF